MRKLLAALVVLLSLTFSLPASAQRLLFEKDTFLFTASEDGKDARRLFEMPSGVHWAASPDGRRIAYWTQPSPEANVQNDIAGRPVTVFVTDLTGRRLKKLFSTATLKDKQGRSVSRVGVPVAHLPRNLSNPDDQAKDLEAFNGWVPYSLSWSSDSRILYFSCYHDTDLAKRVCATLSVDAAAGTAVVDGDGRWKSLAPLVDVEARGNLLIGAAGPLFAPAYAGGGGADPASPLPLVIANLGEGTRTALLTAPEGGELPPYAFAAQPEFGAATSSIAFVGGTEGGIWVTDRAGKSFRRMAEGAGRRPRWSLDGKRLLFLLPRPGATGKVIYDLYSVPVVEGGTIPAPPTLILQGVTWFDLTQG